MDENYGRDILDYFGPHDTERRLYEVFAAKVLATFPDTRVKVHKTQISFYNRHLFAAAWLPFRRMKDRPQEYLLVTFGLGRRLDSPRIVETVEPYPRRWTHHVVVSTCEDIDQELMGWIGEAWEFSAHK
ncbi:DUF5655 domain-containing protein [Corynebacterium comes]|uniref:DUF5655 domain-containing protein n=1 Tax=Corynebacterium comes TaxID=2675218 RepID=A0A6B8WDH0_9CORY|nr:DUF5655 domain-containing protein [Corynebacterium comes]QGU04798.1 hypothetical protein CETAM_07720 [Corynebacterium comes]